MPETTLRHVFRLADGETLILPQRAARRTVDRRGDGAPVETVWEVQTESGLIRRLWPEDIVSWDVEDGRVSRGGQGEIK